MSFLNVVDRIASCNENHLICGANCSEEHLSMVEYGKLIRKDIEKIEKKVCYRWDKCNIFFRVSATRHEMASFYFGRVAKFGKVFSVLCKCFER